MPNSNALAHAVGKADAGRGVELPPGQASSLLHRGHHGHVSPHQSATVCSTPPEPIVLEVHHGRAVEGPTPPTIGVADLDCCAGDELFPFPVNVTPRSNSNASTPTPLASKRESRSSADCPRRVLISPAKAAAGGDGEVEMTTADSHTLPLSDDEALAVLRLEWEPMGQFAALWESRRYVMDVSRLCTPIVLSNLLRNLSTVFTMVFIGHYLSQSEFAGVALGLTFSNLTAISVGVGLASALDTLCSQEYGKDQQSTALGVFLQRAFLATGMLYIVNISIYIAFAEDCLQLFLSADTAHHAATWLKLSPLITLPMVLSACVQKFAQCQGEAKVTLKAVAFGVATNPLLLYAGSRWGQVGFALALGLNRWITFSAVCLMVFRVPKLKHNFGGFSTSALDFWAMLHYFKVGTPSAVAFCADFWGFEAMGVIAGYLGDVQVAAWSLMMTIYGVLFGFCVGISSAACVKVGNELGAGQPRRARMMSLAAILVASVLAVFGSLAIYFLGPTLFRLFTQDSAVIAKGSSILAVAQFTYFLDVYFFVFQGIYRGCGRQAVTAVVLCLGLWGLGVPSAYVLGVRYGMDLLGVSVGLTVGIAAVVPVLWGYYCCRLDWPLLSHVASRQGQRR